MYCRFRCTVYTCEPYPLKPKQKPGEDAPEASKAEPVVEEVDENIDYYRILGVPKSSDLGRIKQAYLRKAGASH